MSLVVAFDDLDGTLFKFRAISVSDLMETDTVGLKQPPLPRFR